MRAHGGARGGRLTAALALALAIGVVIAGALGSGATAHAAGLPCLLNCTTTTATTPAPTLTTSPSPTPTATTPSTTTTTAAPPAPIPLVVPNAEYDGRAGRYTNTNLVTSTDGTKVNEWNVGFVQGRCSDGGAYSNFDGWNHPLRLASGKLTNQVTLSHSYAFARSGKKVYGTQIYTARFSFDHTHLTGTLTDTFRSPHLRCSSGTIRLGANQDGTRQAPVRDSFAATGTYKGHDVDFSLFLPDHELTKLVFDYEISCPHAKPYRGRITTYGVPLSAQHSFSYANVQGVRIKGGYTARITVSAAGAFNPEPDNVTTKLTYSADVLLRSTVYYYDRHGTQVPDVSCGWQDNSQAGGPTYTGPLTYLPSQS